MPTGVGRVEPPGAWGLGAKGAEGEGQVSSF